MVSPWVEPGSVHNEEFRHTSLIATLRKVWNLGDPLTQRDASARTFEDVFTREVPRRPDEWATIEAQPVADWAMDPEFIGRAITGLPRRPGPA